MSQVKKAILESLYSSFKGQVVLANVFRRHLGKMERGKVVSSLREAIEQGVSDDQKDQVLESQMTFLRSAAAMSLAIDAMQQCLT